MTSIGIGEESILYEAKYVFKDFTQIEKELYSLFNKLMT
jgi:beta-phosphoglucomutase